MGASLKSMNEGSKIAWPGLSILQITLSRPTNKLEAGTQFSPSVSLRFYYDELARSGKNDTNQHETALLRIGTSAGDAAMKS
jgi:hypothetical protein